MVQWPDSGRMDEPWMKTSLSHLRQRITVAINAANVIAGCRLAFPARLCPPRLGSVFLMPLTPPPGRLALDRREVDFHFV